MKSLIAVILLMIAAGLAFANPIIISDGPENDYESWIARLHNGRLMTVFCRNPDWASGDLYVSFSNDDGLTWTEPEVIIQANGDQATLSFVQMPSDTIRLYYASNETGYYKIYAATSLDGLVWHNEGPLDLGWGSTTDFYDPTVILEPDSSLTMSYVVMSSGVYVAHCPYNGSWDTDRVMVAASGYRPRIMKHTEGNYLCAYHTRTGGNYEYDVFVKSSTDLTRWSDPVEITGNRNSHDPFICEMYDGSYMIYYARYDGTAYNVRRRRSFDMQNWETEEPVTGDNTNNTQPHLLVEGVNLFMVYAHAVSYPYDHDVYLEKYEYATGIDSEINMPQNIGLRLTAYPNPFNLSTQISITLDRPQFIRLEIFDLLGRLVAAPPAVKLSSGCHSFNWQAEDLISGIYFARLKTDFAEAKIKMMLIK